jgi:hypothetical protein
MMQSYGYNREYVVVSFTEEYTPPICTVFHSIHGVCLL